MRLVRIAALLTLLLAAPAHGDEIERSSVPVQPAREAREGWRSEGFRLSLQLGWHFLSPVKAPRYESLPEGNGFAIGIEPGVRMSRALALSVAMHYGFPSGGLLWGTTANIAWFPLDAIYLGAGLGYGGFLGSCQAGGVLLQARAGAHLVVNDVFSMGPLLQVGGSAVSCKDEPDAPWLHDELFFAWDFAWR